MWPIKQHNIFHHVILLFRYNVITFLLEILCAHIRNLTPQVKRINSESKPVPNSGKYYFISIIQRVGGVGGHITVIFTFVELVLINCSIAPAQTSGTKVSQPRPLSSTPSPYNNVCFVKSSYCCFCFVGYLLLSKLY